MIESPNSSQQEQQLQIKLENQKQLLLKQKKEKTWLEMQGEECSYGSKVKEALSEPTGNFGNRYVKFQAINYFQCSCSICLKQIKYGETYIIQKQKNMQLLVNDKEVQGFLSLIELMISPDPDIESCEVLVTDTCFFKEDGSILFWAKTDKDGRLSQVSGQKIGFQDIIRQKFPKIVSDRKKETKLLINYLAQGKSERDQLKQNLQAQQINNQQKQTTLIQMNLQLQEDQIQNTGKSAYYQDMALVRFRKSNDEQSFDKTFDSQQVKIMKESEFQNLFQLRPTDTLWQTLELLQCSVKSKTGFGTPIFVHFTAPINELNPNNQIDYSYDHFPRDYDLIKDGDDHHFAIKQCFIIAKYVQKFRGMEILQMKAEFFKDENGFIWLFYVKHIHMRKSAHIVGILEGTLTVADVKRRQQQIMKEKEKAKEQLIVELESFENQCSDPVYADKNQNILRVIKYMENHYGNLKLSQGIDEDFLSQNKSKISKVEDVLSLIDPNCNAKSFKELIEFEKQNNLKQNVKCKTSLDQYQDQNKYDFKDKLIIKDYKNLKIRSIIDMFKNDLKQKSQIEQEKQTKKEISTQNDKKLNDFINKLPSRDISIEMENVQQNENIKNIKAELIRNNLLSRHELMNKYKPPVLKCMDPMNNPFNTRTILEPPIISNFSRQVKTRQSIRKPIQNMLYEDSIQIQQKQLMKTNLSFKQINVPISQQTNRKLNNYFKYANQSIQNSIKNENIQKKPQFHKSLNQIKFKNNEYQMYQKRSIDLKENQESQNYYSRRISGQNIEDKRKTVQTIKTWKTTNSTVTGYTGPFKDHLNPNQINSINLNQHNQVLSNTQMNNDQRSILESQLHKILFSQQNSISPQNSNINKNRNSNFNQIMGDKNKIAIDSLIKSYNGMHSTNNAATQNMKFRYTVNSAIDELKMSKQRVRKDTNKILDRTTADPQSMKDQVTSVTDQLVLSKGLISSNEDNTARLNANPIYQIDNRLQNDSKISYSKMLVNNTQNLSGISFQGNKITLNRLVSHDKSEAIKQNFSFFYERNKIQNKNNLKPNFGVINPK